MAWGDEPKYVSELQREREKNDRLTLQNQRMRGLLVDAATVIEACMKTESGPRFAATIRRELRVS